MSQDLVVMGDHTEVSLWRKPEQVLIEAKEAADALVKIVDGKKKKVIFNGETYLECEDWQTVANFYGCKPKTESDQYVEYGDVRGFEATAVVVDRDGRIVGRAISMCLNDEENWGDVPKYEWVNVLGPDKNPIWDDRAFNGKGGYKREKKEVGRTPKPLFQLRSMAQTRAHAKAMKSVFAWVVVLAGYQPTPAEELTGNEFSPQDEPEQKKPVTMPTETKKEEPKAVKAFDAFGKITARQDGKDNALWVVLGNARMAIPADKVSLAPFNIGDKLTAVVIEKAGTTGPFLVLQSVKNYETAKPGEEEQKEDTIPPIPDGTAAKREPDAMDQAIAEGKLDVEGQPMGDLQETRKGVIGKGRQTRLYTLMTQNTKKTGLTREIVHQILDKMDPPVAHLEELPVDPFYKTWERLMLGDEDWRPFLEE